MGYSIRLFRQSDANDLVRVTCAAIETIGRAGYSAAQVAAWAARHPDAERFLARARSGALIWIATDTPDKAVAYCLLEPPVEGRAHLDMLYCDPAHTRKGLADLLLAQAEQHARQSGCEAIYTEASELARAAFERAGYLVTQRRDFAIEYDGKSVPIHNYAMEKAFR